MKELMICLKENINDEDCKNLQQLKNICLDMEKMCLKLELDYKLSISYINTEISPKDINEFFCYLGEMLIGYVGICNFGGDAGEITGMVHPLYRRKGIFTKLYALAKEECKRRGFKNILLVCDNNSASGQAFIKSTNAVYSFSEYEMELQSNYINRDGENITLRKASNHDADIIEKQNAIYFGGTQKLAMMPEDEEKNNRVTYMIELDTKIIGKIKIDFSEEEGFISGFGILPEYRRKGYGKETLKTALHLLSKNNIHRAALEVASENMNALNLYKDCGFVEKSVMDYYEDK